MLRGFLVSLQFFTSIPVRAVLPMDKKSIEKAILAFPLLGIFQGIVYASVFYFLQHFTPFSTLAAAFILWLLLIVLTGGIHLDGWMDASDAFFSYREQKKRLEIMDDPRIGAFGVLSVLVLLSARFLFIYEISTKATALTYLLIGVIPFLGKSVMGWLLLKVRAAKEEGLAHFFQSSSRPGVLTSYLIYLFAVGGIALIVSFNALVYVLILAAITSFMLFYGKRKILKWYGGVTGDVIGAAVEGMELILWMAVWLLHYFAMAQLSPT